MFSNQQSIIGKKEGEESKLSTPQVKSTKAKNSPKKQSFTQSLKNSFFGLMTDKDDDKAENKHRHHEKGKKRDKSENREKKKKQDRKKSISSPRKKKQNQEENSDEVIEHEERKSFMKSSPKLIKGESSPKKKSIFQKEDNLKKQLSRGEKAIIEDSELDEDQMSEEKDEDQSEIKEKEKKFKRDEEDFKSSDKDKRNILHRACLDQQIGLINDILSEYKTVLNNDEQIDQKIQDYVRQEDRFSCSPILIACYKNNEDIKSQSRLECIKGLFEFGADVNDENPRTKWRPINWCCYYSDFESVQFLIEKGAILFLPDYMGNYPIDLAGRQQSKVIVELLFKHQLEELAYFDAYKKNNLNQLTQINIILKNKEYEEKYDRLFIIYFNYFLFRFLSSPILRSKLLYWGCMFNLDLKSIKQLISIPRVYYLAPFLNEDRKTALHAAAQKGHFNIIDFLLKTPIEWYKYPEVTDLKNITYKQTPIQNIVFNAKALELKQYKVQFFMEIINFAKWEKTHIGEFQTKERLSLDYKDLYGNTPLHQASLKGYEKVVRLLLEKGADMEIENKELFRAKELTQHVEVQKVYKEFTMKEDQKDNVKLQNTIRDLNDYLIQILRNYLKKVEDQLKINEMQFKINKDVAYKSVIKSLIRYQGRLQVPDFVIKAKINDIDKSPSLPQVFNLNCADNAELQSLNFQISLLQNAGFQIYLTKSYFEEGCYYIMLRHKEKNLESQAQLMHLQVKLMDSYDLEPFDKKFQELYEPFRSRQRQEIIEGHLKRIMNLNELLQNKIIESYYRMHTFGGIQKIRSQWIERNRWYWPQPLNQMDDYLLEGSNQNFTSVTVLRLYFGERISFFFAWKSYLTCALLFVAIPGVALQIYILATSNYNPSILPYWVFYVCVWSTLQVEFWKRKTSEINTRWGSLDLMQNSEIQSRIIREGFSGDEEIYDVTGEITKYQQKAATMIKLFISIPILSFFIALCIGIFVGVDYLIIHYAQTNQILQIVLGVLQGVGITILNMIYTKIAEWFAYKENHKYQEQYETSIIYKSAAFKFLNSYLAIFYTAFFKSQSTLQSLFALMLPVLIVKQVNYVLLEVFVPQVIYKYKEKQYFQKLHSTIFKQKQLKLHDDDELNQLQNKDFRDAPDKFWQEVFGRKLESSLRAVMKVKPVQEKDKNKKEKKKQQENLNEKGFKKKKKKTVQTHPLAKIKLIKYLDVDAVELNSLKLDFEGTLNYFMEGMIDMGYITLFAAAFPMGPAIALFANIIEIKMKIFSFLHVYKRPTCERCSGIGEWLNVMEGMSMVSVFTNFSLLYLKLRQTTVAALYDYELPQDSTKTMDYSIWLFILSVIILIGLKMFFQWIIPDIPQWVQKEMERMSKKSSSQKGSSESVLHTEQQMQEEQGKYERAKRIYSQTKSNGQKALEEKTNQIEKLRADIQHQKKLNEMEREKDKHQESTLLNIGIQKFKTKDEYDQIELAIIRAKYAQIEHMLLTLRIDQLNQMKTQFIFICQNCGGKEAIFDCETCDECFCEDCYKNLHESIPNHSVMLLKNLSQYNPTLLSGMSIKKRKVDKEKQQKIKYSNDIPYSEEVKRWKKFQYFSLPINQQQQDYFKLLQQIFNLFYLEYIKEQGLDTNSEEKTEYQLDLQKVFKYKFDESKIDSTQEKPPQGFITVESRNIQKILDIEELNIEDKIFLNRLASICFKKNRGKATFEQFYQICKQLQDGKIEKKVMLLIEMMDTNDDGIITKQEVMKIFLTSFVQDTTGIEKITDMVSIMFKDDAEAYNKADAAEIFLDGLKNPDLKHFIEALVQESMK